MNENDNDPKDELAARRRLPAPDSDSLEEDEEGPYFSEDTEDDEDEFEDEELSETSAASRWLKRAIALLLCFALLTPILTYWPQIYSMAAIQFLVKSAQLSQNEDVAAYKKAVAMIRTTNGKGTGFNIDANGLIVTNYHVIANETGPIVVSFADGTGFVARIVATHAAADLALLQRADSQDSAAEHAFPLLPLAATVEPDSYEASIYVIGHPLSFSYVANEGQTLGLLQDGERPLLVIDAPIYKGNSGSPVINRNGETIAVVFATSTVYVDHRKQKAGLAVPVDKLHELLSCYNSPSPCFK